MAIILTNTKREDATISAKKICASVRNSKFILTNNQKVNVTISVGVAVVGENGIKPQEIIEYCDKCLYKAKEQGRNQVVSEV
jgi:diguanylate cyclase (GGDEF)-like protein